MARTNTIRKQVRGFAIVWTLVTLLMGACTFVAIFAAYGSLPMPAANSARSNVALPVATNPSAVRAVVVPTNTPFPTRQPTRVPATEEVVAAQVEEEAETVQPTRLPVDVDEFEVGVQVQVSFDLMDAWMDVASNQLGVDWVKQQIRWEDIEPEQGEYDWGPVDIYLDSAAEHGTKVLISVVTAPDWAREPGISLQRHGPPADPATYAGFVRAILERHPGKVHAVEVWNEMNLDREWTSMRGLNAGNYVALLRETYEAIKEVDPGIIVVSGALSPTGFDDGVTARDDAAFMDALIAAGMLNYTDCVGAHHNGYNVSPNYTYDAIPNDPSATFRGPFDNPHRSWSFRSTLQSYALKIENAGGDQKLCITEFGWPSTEDLTGSPAGFGFADDNTLEEQAEFTVDALNNMQEWGFVRLAFIWNLNYGPQAGWDPSNDNVPYSLIGPDTTFRPAFDAVKEWLVDHHASS
jgi:hypothetical protein